MTLSVDAGHWILSVMSRFNKPVSRFDKDEDSLKNPLTIEIIILYYKNII